DLSLEDVRSKSAADTVFGHEASQQEVLQSILEPQLDRFLQEPGFSAVFLAYGQTGSGKTHTIFGPPGVLTEHDYNESGGYPKTWGFFPYAAVATLTELRQKGLQKRAQLKLTAMEIYLEKMFDLLNDRQHVAVPGASVRAGSMRADYSETRYDSDGKWRPPGKWLGEKTMPGIQATAKEVVMESPLDVVHAARLVEATRSATSHALNHRSSRSHCMITLTLRQIDANGKLCHGRLVFVDLAGSERVGKSGVSADGTGGARAFNLPGRLTVDIPGTRFDEARSVNCSLSALGRVIAALARRDKYVSFRDSALTQMLKDPLTGGAAHVTVILALRAEKSNDSETQSTMRFGTVCKDAAGSGNMRSRASKSVPARKGATVDVSKAVAELQKELAAVTEEVERMKADGQDEHLNTQGFAAPTVQGFLDNKRKFEEAKRQATRYKELLAERRSELRLAGEKEEGDRRMEELQASLVLAQQATFVASGIFYRQVTTGIWSARTPAMEQKMALRDRLAMEIDFLESAETRNSNAAHPSKD
ncbi:KIN14A, partial [Symbiodinium pilosum]